MKLFNPPLLLFTKPFCLLYLSSCLSPNKKTQPCQSRIQKVSIELDRKHQLLFGSFRKDCLGSTLRTPGRWCVHLCDRSYVHSYVHCSFDCCDCFAKKKKKKEDACERKERHQKNLKIKKSKNQNGIVTMPPHNTPRTDPSIQ